MMISRNFTPKFFTLLKQGISKEQLSRDIISGVLVGIVALPLAIAFAIASGVSPEKGLVTAIVGGLIISAFGGSRVQIGGPTGAFIVIVFAVVQEYGVSGLTIATFIAGFILIAMGLLRLGNLLKFISYPLIVGFTSGIAVIIFSSQIKDFLGLNIDSVPADFIQKWNIYFTNFQSVNIYAILISIFTVVVSLNFHRITTKIPGSIVAILISSTAVYYLQVPVTTIGSTFGTIPNSFTLPVIPEIDFKTIQVLIQPAIAIALLGGIQSLLSAVVADGMTGGKHRPNMELIAQGGANCFSAIFGGIPATGAIARTATNVKSGGRTPVAGITHAVVLLLIMVLLAPYASLIPMACLAGILVVVAYHMSEWKNFILLLKGNRSDVLILMTTFFLTVFFDLIIAIEVGMILSGFLLMKRLSESLEMNVIGEGVKIPQKDNYELLFEDEIPDLPGGVVLYKVTGALFFGAMQTFKDTISRLQFKPKVIILRMREVPFIDATGIYNLKQIITEFNKKGVFIIISGLNNNIASELRKGGFNSILHDDCICGDVKSAIIKAKELI